jgi:hypothetical protein
MAQTCPQCQSQASDEANHCPGCGALLSSAAPPPQGPAAGGPPPGGFAPPPPSAATGVPSGAAAVPPYKFDAARWSQADRIAGIATLVLFISLFLPWFTFGSQSLSGL